MNELILFLGRFHPLIVHFPIVLIILAGVFEVAAWMAQRRAADEASRADARPDVPSRAEARPHVPSRADARPHVPSRADARPHVRSAETLRALTGAMLGAGAISAVVAAASGYMLGTSGGYGGPTFERHETLGIVVAFGSLATFVAWTAARGGRARGALGIYRTLLAALVAVLAVAGHFGATLTHGPGYLTEHAPSPLREWIADAFGGAIPPQHVERPDRAVAYTALVQPILTDRCVGCHGPDRNEGELRLDTPAGIRKGGKDGAVIVAGHASDSLLIRRIWLPASHKDAMPPPGRPPVPAWEASVLRWWVDQGAPFDKKIGELDVAADVQPAIEAIVGPLPPGGPSLPDVNVPAPDPKAIAAASRAGASVVPLASGTHFVELHCTNTGTRFGDAQLAALRPLAEQAVWLDLGGTGITDAGLATVAQFKNLTRLHLNRTHITNAGLRALAGLQHLEYLNLYGTRVTDDGLQALAGIRTLRKLYVWQTGVTDQGLQQLRSANPRLSADAGLVP